METGGIETGGIETGGMLERIVSPPSAEGDETMFWRVAAEKPKCRARTTATFQFEGAIFLSENLFSQNRLFAKKTTTAQLKRTKSSKKDSSSKECKCRRGKRLS